MQAAAGKNAQTYKAVMDAIKSRLGVETLVSGRRGRGGGGVLSRFFQMLAIFCMAWRVGRDERESEDGGSTS